MSNLYIPRIRLPILLQPNRQTDIGNILIVQRYLNVGTGSEVTQFHFLDFWYSVFTVEYISSLIKDLKERMKRGV